LLLTLLLLLVGLSRRCASWDPKPATAGSEPADLSVVDERSGRWRFDAQATAAADALRKVLRGSASED